MGSEQAWRDQLEAAYEADPLGTLRWLAEQAAEQATAGPLANRRERRRLARVLRRSANPGETLVATSSRQLNELRRQLSELERMTNQLA